MNENPPATPPPANVIARPPAKFNSPLVLLAGRHRAGGAAVFRAEIPSRTFSRTNPPTTPSSPAHVVSIAPRIAGQVAAVHVLDNQLVRSNDLLVEIDPADYAMTVAQKSRPPRTRRTPITARCSPAIELMRAKVATAEASARKAQADADAAESTAKKAQADFDRAQDLLKQKTISSAGI